MHSCGLGASQLLGRQLTLRPSFSPSNILALCGGPDWLAQRILRFLVGNAGLSVLAGNETIPCSNQNLP